MAFAAAATLLTASPAAADDAAAALSVDAKVPPVRAENGGLATCSDRPTRRVTLQPDLQWLRHAGDDRPAEDRVVVALRLKIDLSSSPAE